MNLRINNLIILLFIAISAVNAACDETESRLYIKMFKHVYNHLREKGPKYECPNDTTPTFISSVPYIQVSSDLNSFSKTEVKSWFSDYLFGSEGLSFDPLEGSFTLDSAYFFKKISHKYLPTERERKSEYFFYCSLVFSEILFNKKKSIALSYALLTINHSKYVYCFEFRKQLSFWKINKCKIAPH